MIPNDFNGNLLSGSDASCIGAQDAPERSSEVRDRRSPKPSDNTFPKLQIRKCEANQDSLSGRKLSLLQLIMLRSLRLANIPKPSENKNEKMK